MSSLPNLDQLHQVHELNRAFLALLQSCPREQLDCMGMPESARAPLRCASSALLDAVAVFPRALFRLDLHEPTVAAVREPLGAPADGARHDLCLSILFAARASARQSAYQARLLFDLEPVSIQQLRVLPLPELQTLAHKPDLVRCAFPERAWLWGKLLTDIRAEERQQLALVALQPGIDREWPLRRAPRAAT
jgi:hypothetical protein